MIFLVLTTSLTTKYGTPEAKDEMARLYIYSVSLPKTLESLSAKVLQGSILPIVVENNGARPTPFDRLHEIGIPLLYTNTNEYDVLSKAEKELIDLKEVIRVYNIQDNDMIIKQTGRYFVNSPIFYEYVRQNEGNFDAVLKFMNMCTMEYTQNDCILGLYAIRCKYLKEFTYSKTSTESPEVQFATWVRATVPRISEVYNLDLVAMSGEDMTLFRV